MSALGRRYARAVVEAAGERGGSQAVAAMSDSLRRFADAFADSLELRELLCNPAFDEQRDAVLEQILSRLAVENEARGVVKLLSARGRIGALAEVVREVEQLADEQANRVRAFVTAAAPLSAEQQSRLTRALEKRLDKKVVVRVSTDAKILGGLVCRVGDLTLDSSLKRQLEQLREQLAKHPG